MFCSILKNISVRQGEVEIFEEMLAEQNDNLREK